jgi:hypothetical protein
MYFYIGDRAQGSSLIEQEVKKGGSGGVVEDSSVGITGPFG